MPIKCKGKSQDDGAGIGMMSPSETQCHEPLQYTLPKMTPTGRYTDLGPLTTLTTVNENEYKIQAELSHIYKRALCSTTQTTIFT